MNIKKISVAARKFGKLYLFDRVDAEGSVEQWISVGGGIYPLEHMPYLQAEHLRSVFFITEKQAEDMIISTIDKPNLNFADYVDGEIYAKRLQLSLQRNGSVFSVFEAQRKSYLIDKDLLVPLITDGEEDFFLRKSESGIPYFAVKRGLFLRGFVAPLAVGEEFKDSLSKIANTLYFAGGGGQ